MGFDFVNTRITSMNVGAISMVTGSFVSNGTASKSAMVRISGSTGIGRLWFQNGLLVSSSYCEDI